MALSGSMSTIVQTHWKLSIEWTATQSITNNTSTITAKMYWESLDSYGAVYSSATKTSAIQHDGGSWSTESAAGMAGLDANQKKLINTYTFTVTHASDGSKSFSLDGYFDAEITLGSSYYSRINLTEKTFTLNDIPRETKLTSSASWTAGNSLSLTFDKASSSFTTNVEIKVNGVSIKTITGITGSTYTYTFSALENENIIKELNKDTTYWNQASSLVVTTKNGSTTIGSSNTYSGTCSSPPVTQVSAPDFNVGDSVTVTMSSEYNSNFVYDLTATLGSYTKTLLTKGGYANTAWTTSSDASSLYGQMSTTTSGTITFTLTTYWKNGTTYTKIRTADTDTSKVTVPSSQVPTFAPSGANAMTYADTDPTVPTVTGSNQYIVQGQSKLVITLPAGGLATPASGTSITKYVCTLNGIPKNSDQSSATVAQTFTFNPTDITNLSTTQDAVVQAIDSRGRSTTAKVNIKVVPYSVPKIVATATRENDFGSTVTLTLSGSVSALNVNGTNKNVVKAANYTTKLSSATTYSGTPTGTFTVTGFPTYSATNVTLTMDTASAYTVKFAVQDNLKTNSVEVAVTAGQPIFFIDAVNKSIGFNDFPVYANEFLMNGRLRFGANQWVSSSQGEGVGGGAMYLNNSDITGLNGLWFNDSSQGRGEGLLFLKTTASVGSTTTTDYDNFYIKDGAVYINDGTTGLTVQAPNQHFRMQRNGVVEWHVESGSGNFQIVKTGDSIKFSIDTTGQLNAWDNLDMNNYNLMNVNHITINDSGGGEGLEWLDATNNWKIVSSPDDGSNATGPIQFFNNGVRQHTFGTTGNFYATGTTMKIQNTGTAYFKGDGPVQVSSDGTGYGSLLFSKDSTSDFLLSMSVYNRTYSNAANMYVTSNGVIGRSTSARKYKLQEKPMDESLSDRILRLSPKDWYDKVSMEAYAEAISREVNGEEIDWADLDVSTLTRIPGLIAEDVVDVGLEQFVTYGAPDEQGNREIEGLMYDRLWVLLIPLIRNQKDKIADLEARLSKLETN